ncbi:hypothetical protein GCM10009872_31750 [Actinopolymorpha rutila]
MICWPVIALVLIAPLSNPLFTARGDLDSGGMVEPTPDVSRGGRDNALWTPPEMDPEDAYFPEPLPSRD